MFEMAGGTFWTGASVCTSFQLGVGTRGAVNFDSCSSGLQLIDFGWDCETRRPCLLFGMASGAAMHFGGVPLRTRGGLSTPRATHEAQDKFLGRTANSGQSLTGLEQRLGGLGPRGTGLAGTRQRVSTATGCFGLSTRGAVESTSGSRVPCAVKSGWDCEN